MSVRLVYDGRETPPADAAALWGGKAVGLARLQAGGHAVPPYFVISSAAFEGVLGNVQCESDRDWVELRRRLAEAQIAPELEAAIRDLYERAIPPDAAVAVRSSAAVEDGREHSYAGIYDSVLGVRGFEALLAAIKRVWNSVVSERAIAYRKQIGVPCGPQGMAVIVQQIVDARQAGVCFTCNPTTGSREELLVHAVLGAGEGLVGEGLPADSFTVSKKSLNIDANVAEKTEQFVLDDRASGLRRTDVDADLQRQPSLTDAQVRQVAQAALAIEAAQGCPQDIEFCFDAAGVLWILQARPVTRCPQPRDDHPPDAASGNQLVWDNSNIIESYSGVTTPMTFSFIRRVYGIVYHCFADVMGIPARVVREHRDAFDNMLGLFRGRVYYNLKNWYRLVRLFPGFEYNRRFMETMMGLKDPLLLDDAPPSPGVVRRWCVEFPALVKLAVRSGTHFWFIRRRVASFQRHFQRQFDQWSTVDFDSMPPHEVMAAYTTLEDELLWNWKAPIINDFYVMIYYGVLRSLCSKWCGDETGALENGLICGEGGLASDEPAKLLLQMAGVVQRNEPLRRLVLEEPVEALPMLVAGDNRFAEFNALMATYLKEYGLRCVGELKLEESSYRDQPHRLYQLLRDYLQRGEVKLHNRASIAERELQVRLDAERQCMAAISQSYHGWWRRRLFQRVLNNARLGIRNRENLRFARTRIYGILRSMLRSIGKHFAAGGVLNHSDDIFYLTLDEVWDFIKGTAVSTDLRGLAGVRRAEYDRYRSESVPAPDNRFVTYGVAYMGNSFRNESLHSPAASNGTLTGTGCCPGVVAGRVQVVRDPVRHDGFHGEILVAERTDPGWVALYPAFSGILIERGSVLSHSAIVAREMGIPTIVGIRGLTERLQSGERVRMDGRAGTVEVIESN